MVSMPTTERLEPKETRVPKALKDPRDPMAVRALLEAQVTLAKTAATVPMALPAKLVTTAHRDLRECSARKVSTATRDPKAPAVTRGMMVPMVIRVLKARPVVQARTGLQATVVQMDLRARQGLTAPTAKMVTPVSWAPAVTRAPRAHRVTMGWPGVMVPTVKTVKTVLLDL
jgi:hypothetical protein